ncbi:MerR family transcriptional regulator [Actinomyces minihominis]|uniref:MerR family transcriptional regulator n=1 Tax=Actinomyces minihominis TaxID=2002838 RepID=UPI000C06BE16|nr:MerR family transcriptional regulator [Actinomyces minihominis]
MSEWPIREVASSTGVTSRTLRHYEQIGILHPSRVAANGYRFYGDAEVARLYRILSLRELDLPLATIRKILDNEATLTEAIEERLVLLQGQRELTNRRIEAAQAALRAVKRGQTMTVDEIFAGFDEAKYEDEVRERWGDNAWEGSVKRRQQMTKEELQADNQASLDINPALCRAADSGLDPAGEEFQGLVSKHHAWVMKMWGGRVPGSGAYRGLADMYVADQRFAATYGGQKNAEVIREAIEIWTVANLD